MYISHIMVYAKQMEEDKFRDKSREKNRARMDDDKSFHEEFDIHGHSIK